MKNILHIISSFLFGGIMITCTAMIILTTGVSPIVSVMIAATMATLLTVFNGYIPSNLSFVTLCGQITQAQLIDCDNPVQGGTREKAYIMNLADLDSITFGADGYTVEAITLAATKKAFVIEGKNNSIAPKATMIEQGFSNMFDHEVIAKGFDISPAVKNELNSMKDGRFVIITENYFKGSGGETAYEIYGITTGLEITNLERDPNNAETQGAFDYTFFTKLNKEPKLPNPLFLTNYATTKAIVDALIV